VQKTIILFPGKHFLSDLSQTGLYDLDVKRSQRLSRGKTQESAGDILVKKKGLCHIVRHPGTRARQTLPTFHHFPFALNHIPAR
jgi:hypothetical protein